MSFVTYIYFNEPEINRLFSQQAGLAVSERWQTDKKHIKSEASAKILGVGGDIGVNSESETKEKKETTSAYKLDHVKNALVSSGQLLRELQDSVRLCSGSETRVYVEAAGYFRAPQFKKGQGGVDQVNRDRSVILECQAGDNLIVMSLSLDHMLRVRNGIMGRLGHDAILLREIGDKAFLFTVFGLLYRISNDELQMRPITVAF